MPDRRILKKWHLFSASQLAGKTSSPELIKALCSGSKHVGSLHRLVCLFTIEHCITEPEMRAIKLVQLHSACEVWEEMGFALLINMVKCVPSAVLFTGIRHGKHVILPQLCCEYFVLCSYTINQHFVLLSTTAHNGIFHFPLSCDIRHCLNAY